MIERYSEKTHSTERIDDGAPTFKIPVYFNGMPNGDTVEATVLIRDVNPCNDVVVMPTVEAHVMYPGTVGWMYDDPNVVSYNAEVR